MKIFFITSKLNFATSGGSIMDIDLKARALQNLNNEVSIITAWPGENKIPAPLPYNIAEENIPSKRLLTIQWGVFKILKKYSDQADVFHVDGHLFLYGAGLYKMLGGQIPIVAHFNRELACWPANRSIHLKKYSANYPEKIKRKLRWYLERHIGVPIANHINLLTFANPILQKTYENFGLKKGPENFVVGDFIDHEKIIKKNDVLPDSYIKRNKNTGPLIIFHTSRMVPGKGFDTLLTAFSKIKNKEKFQLVLGGGGPEEADLHQLANNLKIADRVKFLGWVPTKNIYDYFKKADVFVLPKCERLEFNSITLLEAMTFGLPCIVPANGALAWGAGKSAITYQDENCDDLAAKIQLLGDDPNLRAELSKNCFLTLKQEERDYKKGAARLNEKIQRLFSLKS